MKPGTFMVGIAAILFALSLIANFMTLAQLRHVTDVVEADGKPAPSARPRAAARSVTAEDPRLESVLAEIAALRREVGAQRSLIGGVAESPSPIPQATATTSSAPIAIDPEVETVLAAQADFRRFWRDLDYVFDAQSKIDEGKYQQTVFDATTEFLGIAEPTRSIFMREAEIAVGELSAARQAYSDAKDQMPSKSQVSREVYDAQRKAISDRYRVDRDSAIGRVRRMLDTSSPRHQEFSRRTEKWLRELIP